MNNLTLWNKVRTKVFKTLDSPSLRKKTSFPISFIEQCNASQYRRKYLTPLEVHGKMLEHFLYLLKNDDDIFDLINFSDMYVVKNLLKLCNNNLHAVYVSSYQKVYEDSELEEVTKKIFQKFCDRKMQPGTAFRFYDLSQKRSASFVIVTTTTESAWGQMNENILVTLNSADEDKSNTFVVMHKGIMSLEKDHSIFSTLSSDCFSELNESKFCVDTLQRIRKYARIPATMSDKEYQELLDTLHKIPNEKLEHLDVPVECVSKS